MRDYVVLALCLKTPSRLAMLTDRFTSAAMAWTLGLTPDWLASAAEAALIAALAFSAPVALAPSASAVWTAATTVGVNITVSVVIAAMVGLRVELGGPAEILIVFDVLMLFILRPMPGAFLRCGFVERATGDPFERSHVHLVGVGAVREYLKIDAGITTPYGCNDCRKVNQRDGAVLRLVHQRLTLNVVDDLSDSRFQHIVPYPASGEVLTAGQRPGTARPRGADLIVA